MRCVVKTMQLERSIGPGYPEEAYVEPICSTSFIFIGGH